MRNIVIEDKKEFFRLYFDVFILLNLPKGFDIGEREKEFIVCCMILFNEEKPLDSSDSVLRLSKMMNFKNKDEVYNYRSKLKKKGLLVQTTDGIVLPKGLEIAKVPYKLTFKFACQNEFTRAN